MEKKGQKNEFYGAISILVGTAIGAGIFGIPYVVSQVGFGLGFIYLIVLGLVVILTNLCYGEVVTRTKDRMQMSGYANKYLGKWGKRVITTSLIFGIYGALIAYLIGIGNFLNVILGPYLGDQAITYSLFFYLISVVALFFGLGMVVKIEKIMIILLMVVISIITFFGFSAVKMTNINYLSFSLGSIFVPYGVILFAYASATALPNMRDLLLGRKKLFKKAIILGLLIPVVIYCLFTFTVVGISGRETSEAAVNGLQYRLGQWIVTIGALFGVLSISTSFLALGLVLRELYQYDYKINKIASWLLVVIPPLLIFILKFTTFIGLLGVVGVITGGFEGIIILMMYKKAKRIGDQKPWFTSNLPETIRYILMTMFGLGIVYEIVIMLYNIHDFLATPLFR